MVNVNGTTSNAEDWTRGERLRPVSSEEQARVVSVYRAMQNYWEGEWDELMPVNEYLQRIKASGWKVLDSNGDEV